MIIYIYFLANFKLTKQGAASEKLQQLKNKQHGNSV